MLLTELLLLLMFFVFFYSLGGNCKTTMIATCAVDKKNIDVCIKNIKKDVHTGHPHQLLYLGNHFHLPVCSESSVGQE